MSVLFPKVNKAPEWNWRPIYYDPKKDEMERKLKARQAARAEQEKTEGASSSEKKDYTPSLHRGSFRESHEDAASFRDKNSRKSRLGFWVALLVMLLFFFYWLL